MKSIEQLEAAYQKELALAEKHKKAAADIRKQIDHQQGKMIMQSITALNMSGPEYDKFNKLLKSGKKNVLEAAEQVIAGRKVEKGDGNAETQKERDT